MHQLKGIYGVAYSCSNKNISYCDDWFTNQYQNVFANSSSNKSLHNLKSLGFNNVRTYYLDPNKDHTSFLQLCDQLKLSVEIGISNNLLDNRDINSIQKLINSVKNYNCVKLYTVGNEYFGNVDNIIYGIETVYSLDPNKYIMHSSIFDENFKTAKFIYNKVPNYIKSKYIVGINMYFYNNPANMHGDVLQNVLRDYYQNI
jgi:phenylalanyl-tRNA synthetase beta subunit